MERNTLQKQIVKNALKSMHNHPTATEVYNYIHKDYPSISKATVFRILNNCCTNGEFMKVDVNDEEAHYELKNPPHYHMHCRICNKIFDAPIPFDDSLIKKGFENSDFFVEGHSIEFYGVCKECQKKKEKNNE